MTMRKALKTGYIEMASAFMMMRSDRSLLNSRSTRNVLISRRIDTPGRSGSARLAIDTARKIQFQAFNQNASLALVYA